MSIKDKLKERVNNSNLLTQTKYLVNLGKQYAQVKNFQLTINSLKISHKGELILEASDLRTHFNRYKNTVTLYFKNPNVKLPLSYESLRKSRALGQIKFWSNRLIKDLLMVPNLDCSESDWLVDYEFVVGDLLFNYEGSGSLLFFYNGDLVEGELAINIDDYWSIVKSIKG